MSLINEYNRIYESKNSIINSIINKHVDIPYNTPIDNISSFINNILAIDSSRSIYSYDENNELIKQKYSPNGDCSSAFAGHVGIISRIEIGNNVTNIARTYYGCANITGNLVCGENVTNMSNTYSGCYYITGSPVCGEKVTNMSYTYSNCRNLTGSPVCGNNVTNMCNTYWNCYNITGNPVCGNNVTDMSGAYAYCYNLTGNPVCGDNVTNMSRVYHNCTNLTGNPVCGNKVKDMLWTYWNCTNLTGSPVCGPNVTNMQQTYCNCPNIMGNGYFYSNKISTVYGCFNGRNTANRLNLYIPVNSTTQTRCLYTNSKSLVGTAISWTNDYTNNGVYYSKSYNIYIYPVDNVVNARLNNGD